MALKIRLSRGGSKGDAHYRIVVSESTKSRDGQAVEILGHYHPNVHDDAKRFVIDADKVAKWISLGAKPTEVVARLCVKNGLSSVGKFVITHVKSKNYGKSKKEIRAESSEG